jgi:sporulation integral membrane protein YlbJ
MILLFFKFRNNKYFSNISRLLLICSVLFFVSFLISYPEAAIQSAKAGVDMWFNIVLPSLLPFFIGSELLIRLGVVSFIGSILEPLFRPIFNVPGEGSFVFAMSLTSGYPVGAKLVSKLRKDGIFSKEEGQRVMSFASTSGPLFMLGAVAIGMFHSIALGTIIVLSHYLGAIATGIAFRFYKRRSKDITLFADKKYSVILAFKHLIGSKSHQRQPFGRILGESVKESIETILMVGGFIILFSVIIQILSISKVILFFSSLLLPLWKLLGLSQGIQHGIISGIFEITVGCKLISEVQNISFLQQAIISTMIISWSGLSIIAQAASMIHDTDLSVSVYICSKLSHSFFSGVFAFLLVPIYQLASSSLNIPVFHPRISNGITETWSDKFFFSGQLFIVIILTLIVISIIFASVFNKYSGLISTKK